MRGLSFLVRMVVKGASQSFLLLAKSAMLFFKQPRFIVPLGFMMSYSVLFSLYYSQLLNRYGLLALFFGVLFSSSFVILFSYSWNLELMQHLENGRSPSLLRALKDTVVHNIWSLIPLMLIWNALLIGILVIEVIAKITVNMVASFYGGAADETARSATDQIFDFVRKGMRMFIFLSIPAVAWKDKGFIGSLKEAYNITTEHLSQFSSGFMASVFLAMLFFSPLYILNEFELVNLSSNLFVIYGAVAATYIIYSEQFFTAQLYLWNYRWRQEVIYAKKNGEKVPDLEDVDKPSLIDDVSEFRREPGRRKKEWSNPFE